MQPDELPTGVAVRVRIEYQTPTGRTASITTGIREVGTGTLAEFAGRVGALASEMVLEVADWLVVNPTQGGAT